MSIIYPAHNCNVEHFIHEEVPEGTLWQCDTCKRIHRAGPALVAKDGTLREQHWTLAADPAADQVMAAAATAYQQEAKALEEADWQGWTTARQRGRRLDTIAEYHRRVPTTMTREDRAKLAQWARDVAEDSKPVGTRVDPQTPPLSAAVVSLHAVLGDPPPNSAAQITEGMRSNGVAVLAYLLAAQGWRPDPEQEQQIAQMATAVLLAGQYAPLPQAHRRALRAWTVYGPDVRLHERARAKVRRLMPTLGAALDQVEAAQRERTIR